MSVVGAGSWRPRRALAVLAALIACPAWPDGFSALVEPGVAASRNETESPGALPVRDDSLLLAQRYRLTLDKLVFPLLRFNATGTYEQRDATSDQSRAQVRHSTGRLWGLTLRMDLGGGTLTGGVGYDIRGSSDDVRQGVASTYTEGPLRQAALAFATWRPVDLPSLELRAVRADLHDPTRTLYDETSTTLTLTSVYQPVQTVELRYRLNSSGNQNHIVGTDDRVVAHSLRGSWAETFLDRRASVFASLDLGRASRETKSLEEGASRETPQPVATGLSAVERFPATPERIALDANPALVDGNVATGAGLDLGFGRAEAGDQDPRDMGGRFVDLVTRVNAIRVFVDRRLPPAIAAAFTWTAWQSQDNLTWTSVALGGAVTFDSVLNRFQIPIAQTAARYLKVVTRPLPLGTTTDRDYAEILVTELQAFLIEPIGAGTLRDTVSRMGTTLSGRLILQRSWNVAWDTFVDVARSTDRDFTRWSLSNGLGFNRRLTDTLAFSGRAERTDLSAGRGTETGHRANLSLAAEPLPTLGGSVTASGARLDDSAGTTHQAGANADVRADLYPGVSLSGSGGFTQGWRSGGETTRSTTATGRASVTPHRTVTLGGSFTYSDAITYVDARQTTRDRAARVDGMASWSPVTTIGITATVGHEIYRNSGTLGTLGISASPFRDGALQLVFAWTETLDTVTDVRTRQWGPSLRWRLSRRGFLNVAYSNTHLRSPAWNTDSQAAFANLILNLG